MIQREEYIKVRELIQHKSILLMNHERKNHARVGIAINNYKTVVIGDKTFYLISTNVFKEIIENKLIVACTIFPERFGNGNARDVIKAIYDLEPWFDLDRFIEVLHTEHFCYVVEVVNGEPQENVLRIDLYRDIKENENGGFDFIGGIFHCFKHFSFQGMPLSISKEINDIEHTIELVYKITNTFFSGEIRKVDENTFISEMKISKSENLRLVFYYENITEVYFIKTAHKI